MLKPCISFANYLFELILRKSITQEGLHHSKRNLFIRQARHCANLIRR